MPRVYAGQHATAPRGAGITFFRLDYTVTPKNIIASLSIHNFQMAIYYLLKSNYLE